MTARGAVGTDSAGAGGPRGGRGHGTPQSRRFGEDLRALVRGFSLAEHGIGAACCGMTPAQAATLGVLRREGPLRMGALAERLCICPSTLSRSLRRIEKHGLVRRRRDPADSRAEQVDLTPRGRHTVRSFDDLVEELAVDVLGRLSAPRRAAALRVLADVGRALREATEDCCPERAQTCPPWGLAGRRRRRRKETAT